MKLEHVLGAAIRGEASDVILKTGCQPRFRHNGRIFSLKDGGIIDAIIMKQWIDAILPSRLRERLEKNGDADFTFETSSKNRFRVNVFRQRKTYSMVMRVISSNIKTLDMLHLPKVVETVVHKKRGLVLVTGATGSGKSTTLAAIIQEINRQRSTHIITVEDPIEFEYTDDKSTINQREIGEDASDFATALRACLRQTPDIILVGELRDQETTETALMAAETGHLVFSTLHTKHAVDTITRLLSYFPPNRHQSLRVQLAASLEMIISQRLVPKADGNGQILAAEILVANSLVRDVIATGENFDAINEAIKKGQKNYGMCSFDQSILELFNKNIISEAQAIHEASSRENMKLLISGVG